MKRQSAVFRETYAGLELLAGEQVVLIFQQRRFQKQFILASHGHSEVQNFTKYRTRENVQIPKAQSKHEPLILRGIGGIRSKCSGK
jgi:hypothetical protein